MVIKNTKAIGIDYGDARIGIALSDGLKMLASPFDTIVRKNKSEEEVLDYIVGIIKNNNVDTIIVGLPLNMQGEEQEIAQKARNFGQLLGVKAGMEINFVDERLTSSMAEDILIKAHVNWRDRKKLLDKISAANILQTYLDKN